MKSVNDGNGKLPVMHLMRTYGEHGGEQQLSQYFGAEPKGAISETMVFIFSDSKCSKLFRYFAPNLRQRVLLPFSVSTGSAWLELAKLLPLLLFLQFRFLSLFCRLKPAVVVVHGFQGALVAWPVALVFRKVRWVYVHRVTKSTIGKNLVLRCVYRVFDYLAGNSKAVTESLASLATRGLITLDNGLDWGRFHEKSKTGLSELNDGLIGPSLVCVGRLLPHKGQDMIIDAFEIVAKEVSELQLWVIGEGGERDKLERKVAKSFVKNRVHFFGQRKDVPALLTRATIFVNASSREGMSNAVLEGMAAGIPSVVVDAPGVTECHVDGVTGLVVQNDAKALAQAVCTLLEDPQFSQKMGHAALLHVKKVYSMEACRKRYLDLFGLLVGRDLCAES